MVLAYPPAIFSEVLDFIVSSPSPEEIISFKPSANLEAQLEQLLTKNKQNQLTIDEREELDSFLQLNHFMNMLKIRARQKLASYE